MSDDEPHVATFLGDKIKRCTETYYQTIEAFSRSIGVNESNAHKCELRHLHGDLFNSDFFRNGVKVGEVRCRWENDESGYRFVVECKSV